MKQLEFDCIIYDSYKELLKKKVYEPIILKLMNHSEIVFRGKYKYIEKQSHKESDFISETGDLFDAKILFYERQCQALAINKDNLYTFINGLQIEINEIYDAISENNSERLFDSIFYKEMLDRISKAERHENIILFVPFACTLEISSNLESLVKKDIFTYIFEYLRKNKKELILGHNIYIIYPNCENYVIIKNLSNNLMELVHLDVFSKYIRFEIRG